MQQKILLVDDEPKVLSALQRELTSYQFTEILTANSGMEALDILRQQKDVAVIVSDYRMPGLDGISFLMEAQEICPDATRMILSGVADLEMATNSINLGQVFRLLIKPCPTDSFINSIKAGLRQYELITSEHDLLQNTLKGSIKILTDLLSAISPDSFSQANRISSFTRKFAQELHLPNAWELELAGALCRIGCVTIPPEVIDSWMKGKYLDPNQFKMMDSVGKIGNYFLRNIPRLEKIAEGILFQSTPFEPTKKQENQISGSDIPLISRILKIVIDYDRFLAFDQNSKAALTRMLNQANEYDPELMRVFREQVLTTKTEKDASSASDSPLTEVTFDNVKNGMVIMANVFDNKGRMLISKGTVVTEILQLRLANYCRVYGLDQPLLVKKLDAPDNQN